MRTQRRFVIATGVVPPLAMTVAAHGLILATTATVGSALVGAAIAAAVVARFTPQPITAARLESIA